jgi:fructose-1,6-bisphosphatase/inositol monophosphatase family enzyme
MFVTEHQRRGFERINRATRMVRYSGDCVNYGLLAAGHADLVVENLLQPYDIIPLIPIVEAAGGVITDLSGRRPVDGGYVVAASTPELHRAALELLTA